MTYGEQGPTVLYRTRVLQKKFRFNLSREITTLRLVSLYYAVVLAIEFDAPDRL
jgi:hypothetical protein